MKIFLLCLLNVYRLLISPWFGNCCRFYPNCSTYAIQAIQKYGAWHGTKLTFHRLSRCHPWHPGGIDFVPEPCCTTAKEDIRKQK